MLTVLGATLPQETKDKLFITSLENVEYSILLETEARTMKWGWLFRTYVQWHAIAFLLSELCVRTKGEAVERAWRALEATAGRWWFPLNDNSPYRKGQQGCLWKPLKKLLAKAKAAREKELTLERASIALRNGQLRYPGFAPGGDQSTLPRPSASQPGSENLDRMLRPSAPRLGESPLASQSSWPSSPSVPKTQVLFPGEVGTRPAQTQRPTGAVLNGTQGNHASPARDFHDLTNFGLDNVLNDVMENMDYEGNAIYDFDNLHPMTTANHPTPAQLNGLPNPTTTAPTNTAYNTATVINRAHGTFGDASLFGNVDFANVSPEMANNTNGQLTESPVLDSGAMDWTQWDDLVTQYGLEGHTQNPNSNPASHQGLVHWF